MKKLLTILIFAATLLSIRAQVTIGGHRVVADNAAGLWLCATAEENFGHDLKCEVTYGGDITALNIDGRDIASGDSLEVAGLSAATALPVVAHTAADAQIVAELQFTFLPIVDFSSTEINKNTFVTVPFSIIRPSDADMDLLANMRYRGSLVNYDVFEKRSYKVKFIDSLGNKLDVRPFPELRNDNNWVLGGGAADMFRIRDYVARGLWLDMVTPPYYFASEPKALSASRGQLVELFRNGVYVGVYSMGEPIDRKQMKLVKYDPVTLEIHGQLWKSDDRSRITLMDTVPPKLPNGNYYRYNNFETKYPDIDDVKPTDYTALYNLGWLSAYADDSTFTSEIANRVDIPVIIDYYIFCEALLAFDNEGKNVYWACYDRTQSEKLTPAIWDIDISFGQDWKFADMHSARVQPWGDYFESFYNHHRFLRRLRRLNVDGFNQKVIARYRELRQNVLTDESLCNRFVEVVDMLKRSGTAAREQKKYSPDIIFKQNIDFDAELAYVTNWIPRRMHYLDNYVFVENRITRGDFDDNGIFDVDDVNGAINMILGIRPATPLGDVTYDSKVDVDDVNRIINKILGKDD